MAIAKNTAYHQYSDSTFKFVNAVSEWHAAATQTISYKTDSSVRNDVEAAFSSLNDKSGSQQFSLNDSLNAAVNNRYDELKKQGKVSVSLKGQDGNTYSSIDGVYSIKSTDSGTTVISISFSYIDGNGLPTSVNYGLGVNSSTNVLDNAVYRAPNGGEILSGTTLDKDGNIIDSLGRVVIPVSIVNYLQLLLGSPKLDNSLASNPEADAAFISGHAISPNSSADNLGEQKAEAKDSVVGNDAANTPIAPITATPLIPISPSIINKQAEQPVGVAETPEAPSIAEQYQINSVETEVSVSETNNETPLSFPEKNLQDSKVADESEGLVAQDAGLITTDDLAADNSSGSNFSAEQAEVNQNGLTIDQLSDNKSLIAESVKQTEVIPLAATQSVKVDSKITEPLLDVKEVSPVVINNYRDGSEKINNIERTDVQNTQTLTVQDSSVNQQQAEQNNKQATPIITPASLAEDQELAIPIPNKAQAREIKEIAIAPIINSSEQQLVVNVHRSDDGLAIAQVGNLLVTVDLDINKVVAVKDSNNKDVTSSVKINKEILNTIKTTAPVMQANSNFKTVTDTANPQDKTVLREVTYKDGSGREVTVAVKLDAGGKIIPGSAMSFNSTNFSQDLLQNIENAKPVS